MKLIIDSVLSRKNSIITQTMAYQEIETTDNNHHIERKKIYDFFNNNFNDNEIMVIQSIMYFGRDCSCQDMPKRDKSIENIIKEWMKELRFEIGASIDKGIEIDQMISKKNRIGTYFKSAFEYFDN